MARRTVERIVHFDFRSDEIVRSGCVHFGFHDRHGRHYGIMHQRHFFGLIGGSDQLVWTVAPDEVFADVANIPADLEFPMYVDALNDDALIVSNFKSAELYRIDVRNGRRRRSRPRPTSPARPTSWSSKTRAQPKHVAVGDEKLPRACRQGGWAR